jgi:hypothetical protein
MAGKVTSVAASVNILDSASIATVEEDVSLGTAVLVTEVEEFVGLGGDEAGV